jgi:DNA-binding transcriptional ArsR family regulator
MDNSDVVEAFGTLADETRLGVLRALVRTDGPLRFSELRARVDVHDSGRFAYHLDRLLGRFVEERADGYALTRTARERLGAASGDPEFEVRLSRPW